MICDNCILYTSCHIAPATYNKEECKQYIAKACYNCNYTDTLPLDEPCYTCKKHSHWRDIQT